MGTNIYPKLPDGVVIKNIEDKYLFLVPSKPDWVVVNKNGAYLLSMCDGQRSIDELLEIITSMHPDIDGAKILLSNLYCSGFFEQKVEDKNIEGTSKFLLKSIHLNISEDCNLSCKYCYAEERKRNGYGLSLVEYKALIDSFDLFGSQMMVALTGGEPLLNPDCLLIADYARKKGHYVYLLTNGTIIDTSNYRDLMRVVDEFRISVDGYYAETHDAMRGIGSYKKTIKAIELLDAAGANIKIAMTVTKDSIGEVELMSDKYGSRLIYQPMFNAGGAKDCIDISVSGLEYYDALNKAKNVNPISEIGFTINKLKGKGTRRCAMGSEEISISYNGDVYPCHMLHLPEFYCGNIRSKSLDEIYLSSEMLCRVRGESIYTYNGCGDCPIRLICGGACRARTYYMKGLLTSQDDFCEYELMAYTDGLIKSALFGDSKDACACCGGGVC